MGASDHTRRSLGLVETQRVVLFTADDPLVLESGATLGPVEGLEPGPKTCRHGVVDLEEHVPGADLVEHADEEDDGHDDDGALLGEDTDQGEHQQGGEPGPTARAQALGEP